MKSKKAEKEKQTAAGSGKKQHNPARRAAKSPPPEKAAAPPDTYIVPGENAWIVDSPLAQQGLHPAFVLGYKQPGWLPGGSGQAAAPPADFAEDVVATPTFNPHTFRAPPPPLWPSPPQRRVPGFIFEGAELWKGPAADDTTREKPRTGGLGIFGRCCFETSVL